MLLFTVQYIQLYCEITSIYPSAGCDMLDCIVVKVQQWKLFTTIQSDVKLSISCRKQYVAVVALKIQCTRPFRAIALLPT